MPEARKRALPLQQGKGEGVKALQQALGALFLGLQCSALLLHGLGVLDEKSSLKLLAFLLTTGLGVLLLPRPRKRALTQTAAHAMVALVVVATAAVCMLPWLPLWPHATEVWGGLVMLEEEGPRGYGHGPFLEYVFNLMCVAVVTLMLCACLLAWRRPSSYGGQAVRILAAVWLSVLVWTLQDFAMFAPDGGVTLFFTFLALTLDPVQWAATMVLFMRRAEQVTQHSQNRPVLVALAWMAGTAENLLSVSPVLQGSPHAGMWQAFLSNLGNVLLVIFVMVCAYPLARRLRAQHRLLRLEARRLTGVPRMEALWAAKMLRCELWAVATALVCTTLMRGLVTALIVLEISRFTYSYLFLVILPYRLWQLAHAGSLAILSGLLWSRDVTLPRPQPPSRGLKAARDMVWQRKVRELAERGFALSSLLDFMELLLQGKAMPGFDVERSSTHDVVRRAVIPMSRGSSPGEGVALATVWNAGRPRLAERMVTHNWDNVFSHLVAAIVADGLSTGCYEDVIPRLASEEQLQGLREELRAANALSRSYWVCAFSVNQHASICDSFGTPPPEDSPCFQEWRGRTLDSATGEAFTACGCCTAKYLNDEPASTELNKFDDMMALLAEEAPGFAHVVAVDQSFAVFLRAWCVAEMVEGGGLQVPQSVVVHSQASLEWHYEELAALDVRDCEATRAEDKEEILARIEDVAAFNEYLQWMLFDVEGLFAGFIDQEARLTAVGSILRRAERSSQRLAEEEKSAV